MSVTLTSLQEAAAEDFGDLSVQLPDGKDVIFLNPIRLSKAQRATLAELHDDEKSVFKDQDFVTEADYLRELLRPTAKSEADFDELAEVVGDDGATWATIVKAYEEKVKLGEASPSEG